MASAEVISDDENCPTKKIKLHKSADAVPVDEEKEPKENNSMPKDSTEETNMLRETDVGIMEYLSELPGFSGVIKQRYSDFLVNEISLDGNVVHLTDLEINSQESKNVNEAEDNSGSLAEIFGESLEPIQNMYDQQDRDNKVYVQVPDDKEARTKIHQSIKKHFPGLDSKTTMNKGNKCIEVMFADCKNKDKSRWDKKIGEYCCCVLYKESVDTMQAVNIIAKLLRIPPGKVCYAGTKDKRAKTCQQICVHRVTQERLHQLNLSKQMRNIAIGNFRYCKNALQLGDLRGNHFTVVLRNVDATLQQIESSLKSLSEKGFINYYGMQRFGTTSVPTFAIGRCMIQSKWTEVIDLILKPRTGDNPQMAAARDKWLKTKNASEALKCLGHRSCNERHLLHGISKRHENDLVGALGFIPRNSRLMYLHSYQSYIWNRVVSKRVKRFGLQLQEGDLVMPAPSCHDANIDIKSKEQPTIITENNRHQYSIYDVVLPLPGHSVICPENETKNWYEELLEKDGLSMKEFSHHIKDYSLSGDYRHVFVKPEQMSWSLHRYDDVTKSLVLSDLEKLKGEILEEPALEGRMMALKVEFSLPSSTYATMALREILKCDTSSAHQSTLNVSPNVSEEQES